MKKVGILNFHYSTHNYGAVLQAAALNQFVQNTFNYTCEHIDYIPPRSLNKQYGKYKRRFKNLLKKLGLSKKKLKHQSFENPYVFEEFRANYLPRSKQTYTNADQLTAAKFDYDYVIVGSDQVWRPQYTKESSLIYFLSFLSDNVKRISYAASFGTDKWDLTKEQTQPIIEEVRKFSAISVRENTGVSICNNNLKCQASHVLDPTLLIGREFFDEIASKDTLQQPNSDIVFYKLDIDKEFEHFINKIETQRNANSKNIYYHTSKLENHYYDVSSWLSHIKNSKIVVTDSFHCVCFAILFEVQFIYYPNDSRGLTRLKSLLTQLDLTQYMYTDTNQSMEQLLAPIDYKLVNQKLKTLRGASNAFLAKAFEESQQ